MRCAARRAGRHVARDLWRLLSAVLLAACGGSSSETPWPVEPIDVDLSPRGEASPAHQPGYAGLAAAAEDEELETDGGARPDAAPPAEE